MKYYIMEGEGVYPVQSIKARSDLPGGPWYHGRELKINVPVPVVYELDTNYRGVLKMLYDNKQYPLIHDRLLHALQDAGVNNLELFPALIINEETGETYEDYHAFNIVGVYATADMENSTLMSHSEGEPTLDFDFESLHLKEGPEEMPHVFRLKESLSAICVSEKIRNIIEERGIPGIVFYDNGEWSG